MSQDPEHGPKTPAAGTLTHLDSSGHPHMVHVGEKADSARVATAEAWIRLAPETLRLAVEGGAKKGDVLQIARLAGIQGAKRTADLIPLCHPLPLDGVDVDIYAVDGRLRVVATARTRWRTGVEMEAMTAATAAALTVYDMLKGVERGIVVESVRLLEKSGGKSGHWIASAG